MAEDEGRHNLDKSFFAESVLVGIVPYFRHETIYLASGKFGPFQSLCPTLVPLWVAILMKRGRFCRIEVPEWMECENLERKIREEQEDKGVLHPVDFYWEEIASLILENAADDIKDLKKTTYLLNKWKEVRQNKIGIGEFLINNHPTEITNIGARELDGIRKRVTIATDYVCEYMDVLNKDK